MAAHGKSWAPRLVPCTTLGRRRRSRNWLTAHKRDVPTANMIELYPSGSRNETNKSRSARRLSGRRGTMEEPSAGRNRIRRGVVLTRQAGRTRRTMVSMRDRWMACRRRPQPSDADGACDLTGERHRRQIESTVYPGTPPATMQTRIRHETGGLARWSRRRTRCSCRLLLRA